MRDNSFLVVLASGSFLGILTPSDIIESPHQLVIDCLHDKPRVDLEQDLESVLILMKESGNPALPVFEGDKFVGVITPSAITDYLRLHSEIMRNMAEGVILIRVSDNVIVYTNPKFEEMFGYGPGELLGKNVSIVNAPTDKSPEEVAAEIQKRLRENNIWQGEVYNIKKDGTPFWCYANVSTFNYHDHGEVWLSVHTDITERKRLAEELRRFKAIADIASYGVAINDLEGNFLYLNEVFARMHGYRADEVIGKNLSSFHNAGQLELVRQGLRQLKEELQFNGEIWHTRKDGSVFPALMSCVMVKDEGGRPLFIAATAIDITERKKAEEELREREATIRALMNTPVDSVVLLDAHGIILDINKTGAQRIERRIDELIGKCGYELLPPEVANNRRARIDEVVRSGVSVRFEDERAGIWVDNSYHPIFDAQGKVAKIAIVARDITERKKAEEKLKNSEAFVKRLIESSNDCIKVLDLEGRLLFMNKGGQQLLDLEDITPYLNKSWLDFLKGDDNKVAREAVSKAAGGGSGHFEGFCPTNKGTPKWWDIKITPIRTHSGKVETLLCISRDITKRKQAEEALKKAKKEAEEAMYLAEAANKAKSDFLANMSHELTTPLNSIIGFSQILQDGLYGELNENQKEYISDILSSGMILLARITDMLDFSKIESGEGEIKISKFLLKDILRSSIAFFNKEALKHNIKISLEIEREADTEIEADSKKLMHIMFKLLSNAIKFTPEGRSVHVRARRVEIEKMRSSEDEKDFSTSEPLNFSTSDRNFIEISVTDTGIGIKPEDMSKLFQIFSQIESPYKKRYAGTGLGLVLTKKLIELHGGKIWVESKIGEGSRVTFVIPVTQIASI